MSPDVPRREFLRGAARTVLVGGLTGGCALLVLRPARGDCVKVVACGDCASYARGCGLPKAEMTRQRQSREVTDA